MKSLTLTPPRLIAWEVTRRCTLNCLHCRASAQNIPYQNEFSFAECRRLLDGMTCFSPPPIIILTGGDPMLRDDIFEIISYGSSLGLRMVIALCGQGLSRDILERLKACGILKISFSLDGSTAATHDAFRREEGAFDAVLRGMALAREVGIPFQVNSTISTYNVNELPAILDLAVQSGADAFHPFLLVPTGNAKDLMDMELSPEAYEKTLLWIYEESQRRSILVKPTCAPHYSRIMRQQSSERQKHSTTFSHPGQTGHSGHPHGSMSSMTKGCLGGQGFAFVSHIGKVQICGFLDVECGDVRQADFDFQQIWETSPVFLEMRDTDGYHGKCGVCEYRNVCGGCRARAYNVTGDYLDSEPFCAYIPENRPETREK
ncbi:radical SAM domain protein [Candidatus Moduliflexus flocculans]|uniref:Radical SAM domain protein n=1 Tax=Candidatus Moduliflexus flocculans TaxID=1499966 RepID=A0A081BRD4_9BACT|nr:radical SAM domain protein [Candidatus Moduliflexus flocculans]